jgi:serine/threonine protein kinase
VLDSQNVLVDEQARLKICDFGLSQVKESFCDVKNANIIGTPQWCAPELLRNEQYDEKVDVYSYGIMLWELVTRSGPYPSIVHLSCSNSAASAFAFLCFFLFFCLLRLLLCCVCICCDCLTAMPFRSVAGSSATGSDSPTPSTDRSAVRSLSLSFPLF